MTDFIWNNVKFRITDIGGGSLGENIPRHAHAKGSYELHFITGGKGELITDSKSYDLKSGDFFITGENVYHSQNTDERDRVTDVFITLQAGNCSKASAAAGIFLNTSFCFFRDIDNSIPLEILKEYREKKPDYESAVNGLTMKMLTDITRLLMPQGFKEAQNGGNLNDRRFVLIEQAFLYTPDLTLTQLAEEIGVCERQTQRLLKKYYGKSFREKKKELKKQENRTIIY